MNCGTGERRVIVSADDFGLSPAVNEAIERAHRDGILSTASLMVAGPAAADAVERAKRLPRLRVGLHLVVVEGPAILPRAAIPLLVGAGGQFEAAQTRLAVRYFFDPRARRQLRREIVAQFRAFAETGLALDHANAHKHMHLHPVVGRMMIEEGQRLGLPAIRVPAEPPGVMGSLGEKVTVADRVLFAWTGLLRRQASRAGLSTNDHVFGIRWSGHMTRARIERLGAVLPPGVSEVYFHPATHRDASMLRLMPDYEPVEELEALLSGRVAASLPNRITYQAISHKRG